MSILIGIAAGLSAVRIHQDLVAAGATIGRLLPTKPYTLRHKGKIEAGVKYVKNNA